MPVRGTFILLMALLFFVVDMTVSRSSTAELEEDRFAFLPSNIIQDRETGLDWYVVLNGLNWDEASDFVSTLHIDGGGWRMPTRAELSALVQFGEWNGTHNLPLAFRAKQLNIWWVWAEEDDADRAWCFFLHGGNSFLRSRVDDVNGPVHWTFAVRETDSVN